MDVVLVIWLAALTGAVVRLHLKPKVVLPPPDLVLAPPSAKFFQVTVDGNVEYGGYQKQFAYDYRKNAKAEGKHNVRISVNGVDHG